MRPQLRIAPFSKNAGSASSLLGFVQLGVGGLISFGVGLLHEKGSYPTSLLMMITAAIALTILFAGRAHVKDIVIADSGTNNAVH